MERFLLKTINNNVIFKVFTFKYKHSILQTLNIKYYTNVV